MAKNKEEKTNVMRTLDQRKVPYTPHTYDPNGPVDGVSVAAGLGMDPASVFKTLVAKGASGAYYVFDIPVAESLDLKKAARAVGGACHCNPIAIIQPCHRVVGANGSLTGYAYGLEVKEYLLELEQD